ncbi:hypothetical protein F2Q70_00007921 [Brassica cretica]|uniref:Profilin n=1 Tax=Brassica cretica TaxID=69181 RepID=A0A8S9M2G8_BRACR|nr:hypothetical protein F2Q70_00007921 [Brassica cretica]
MVLRPSELSKLQFSTRHQTLFSFILSHGESDRLGTVVAAPTPLSFLWSSVMVCFKIGVVVVSFWECSCPAFGYGFLMSLDLSIEYHYCTWVVWYWKPPWSCIRQTMEIRLSQSSLRHTHSSCNGENDMIMLALKPEEIEGINKDFSEPGSLAPTGLFINGAKYMVIQGEPNAVIRGKKGAGGVTIKKTTQALVFGIYEEPVTPGQCNMVVERLGDYLIESGL